MGLFWADASVSSANQPSTAPNAAAAPRPPPSCPMHQSASSKSAAPSAQTFMTSQQASCPIKAPRDATTAPSSRSSSSLLSRLNPLNYMPSNLSQDRAPNQTIHLPTDRELSTIPRGDTNANWEYPSPQQMYNALLRKGYDDTPQDAIESMVAVHNFLNEGAWAEIVGWERRFSKGLVNGWLACKNGEAAFEAQEPDREVPAPRLAHFQGRPGDMTPKAKILQMLGNIYPSKFRTEPPFDRHDWYVVRHTPGQSAREVRYVIDYYAGPPEPTGEPVFYLDVRPAVDGPVAACERLLRWGGETWYVGSGAEVRQQNKAQDGK